MAKSVIGSTLRSPLILASPGVDHPHNIDHPVAIDEEDVNLAVGLSIGRQ
jgi:hypothetical protein